MSFGVINVKWMIKTELMNIFLVMTVEEFKAWNMFCFML